MPALLTITVLAFAAAPVAHAEPDFNPASIPPGTVLIGKAGNNADGPAYGHSDPDQVGRGSVSYDYYIGKSEVTNAQYALFLNSVAKVSDNHTLYNMNMDSNASGGITRSGGSGSYTYTAKTGFETKPVNYVSFFDAARFCNWLTNGANGSASTETGMYTLADGGIGMTRDADAWAAGGYAITSEDEWYKAAYYNLKTETYTTYATGSTINTGQANYSRSWYNSHDYTASEYLAPAGSYPEEQNGTVDMMGNVREWNEAIISSSRGIRAGDCVDTATYLASSSRDTDNPVYEGYSVGFRLSTLGAVPEPSTYGILGGAAALLGAIALRRRNRRD